MRFARIALLVLALVASGAAPAQAAGPSAVVRTDKGAVRGQDLDGHRLFQGIPFAQPPVGDLRWRAPRPAHKWRGVHDATSPRSQCAQLAPPYGGESTYGEDCLYLNVTAPDTRRKLPVMVWLHGGGNTTGSGAGYDASKLALDGDAVVVTVNYRLGPLGWLAHPDLEQGGNYGLLDQQAALRWVRANISAFGGDPRNVTLFGESAGAADSCAHLASPSAGGLFHKAIPQSYACGSPTRTVAGAEAEGTRLAGLVGCDDAECLRRVPARRLLETFQAEDLNAGPVAGTRVLPLQPREAFERGRFHRVPVMHGNTLDEMRLYVGLAHPQPITEARYEEIVRSTYGADADRVLARYPAGEDPRIALATIQTDASGALSTCSHQTAFGLFGRAGVPVYAYQFADRTAPPLIDLPGFEEGAEHATELTYLFPGLLGELDDGQRRLSDDMVGYWTSFARTGRPKARAARWPKFRSSGDVLSLAPGDGGIAAVDTADRSNCAFWKSLG